MRRDQWLRVVGTQKSLGLGLQRCIVSFERKDFIRDTISDLTDYITSMHKPAPPVTCTHHLIIKSLVVLKWLCSIYLADFLIPGKNVLTPNSIGLQAQHWTGVVGCRCFSFFAV